ncbi:MAG TPA: Gfo/Idh/MocA family oxidoreductase [Microvirga sp.]|jgi:ornithine cyclodeaminase/alanine dehydrogenase|nr:Gfo/Idh/MocA family oxidoreductase [Microvirga sp.]
MSASLLYLSRADVRALAIAPREAREAVLQAFRDHAAGRNRSLPKSTLELGPGHGFQAMVAASAAQGIATVKWVAMAPVLPDSLHPGVNALICVGDVASGAPLAVLDGDEITLLRTAALSAAAASYLSPPQPRTIGFVGCGRQAQAHLDAFLDLHPGLTAALAVSRSRASAQRLAQAAAARGLAAEALDDPDALLARSDIVITTVPAAPGLRPVLDAARMKPAALACAVDAGRSWHPESLAAFDLRVTDSLAQTPAPLDADGRPVAAAPFRHDLADLARTPPPPAAERRALFAFRGVAIADLALAHLALAKARAAGLGTALPR